MSPFYQVKIVDEHDNELPAGQVGEIVVRPNLPYLTASGYIGMPEKTVYAWRNLWLHSGDNGRVDEDGWYYFEDRKNDYMRRRGENISSFEVELMVGKHPAVSEVAAVAYPSKIGEDEVRVFVIVRDGHTLTPEQLFCRCRDAMPYFMVPCFIDIVNEFPRTPTAKIDKYKLRQMPKTDTSWDCIQAGWTVSKVGITKNSES
ncbi:AMP-binding enzyme [Halioxenophilus aromaticivorans]|uniref:AMP-binding enzyme C-terminal domain-containing protein n=1 Tax=Halioxenophilus aromaticivorans TaxID=1306992 RepID=A0AAV3TXE0_9ALTE